MALVVAEVGAEVVGAVAAVVRRAATEGAARDVGAVLEAEARAEEAPPVERFMAAAPLQLARRSSPS